MEKDKEKKNHNTLIIVICIVAAIVIYMLPIIVVMIGIILSPKSSYQIMDDGSIDINRGNLTIEKQISGSYIPDDKCYCVQGLLVNNTDKKYEYVNITYTFYDDKGFTLGNETAYLDSIDSNGKWKFKVKYCDIDSDQVSSFKFSSADAYLN